MVATLENISVLHNRGLFLPHITSHSDAGVIHDFQMLPLEHIASKVQTSE